MLIRYWHDFNNFQFQLTSHQVTYLLKKCIEIPVNFVDYIFVGSWQEERDAILAKIEVSQAHLELLKRTNVLNDAFFISHEGEFGTINNFRLGRLPKIQVLIRIDTWNLTRLILCLLFWPHIYFIVIFSSF